MKTRDYIYQAQNFDSKKIHLNTEKKSWKYWNICNIDLNLTSMYVYGKKLCVLPVYAMLIIYFWNTLILYFLSLSVSSSYNH